MSAGPDFPPEELIERALDRVTAQVTRQFTKKDDRDRSNRNRRSSAVARPKTEDEDKRVSPVTLFVRSLGDYYTSKEVAEKLGVSVSLVRKMAREGATDAPSYVAEMGHTTMSLYTPEDIDTLRKHLNTRNRVRSVKDVPGHGNPNAPKSKSADIEYEPED